MEEEVESLQQYFTEVVAFTEKDINNACDWWKAALIGKFLGKGLCCGIAIAKYLSGERFLVCHFYYH